MGDPINVKPDSYSVKTSTDVTERLQELIKKTGLNHKDLFAAMVTRFYTELETGSEIDQSDDMQQIRYHLNRVENIFLGALQKVQDIKKDYAERLETQKTHHKETEEDLQKQKNKMTKELEQLSAAKVKAENQLQETLSRNQELEETNRANRITIDLLNRKMGDLESKAQAAEALEEELAQLQSKNLSSQQERATLRSEIEKGQQTIATLEDQLIQTQEQAHQQANELMLTREKEIQQLQEVHKLEMDKSLLESERRVLENVQKVKDDYINKRESLLAKNEALINNNQDLTAKIHTLELELQRLLNREGQKDSSHNNP